MALPADSLTVMRQWIGDEPVDATLDILYDALASHDAVVLHVLRSRLAAMTLEPASVTVPGLSVSHGVDYQALESLIKKFLAEGGTGLDETRLNYGFELTSMKRNYPR